jgi:glycosyltransferase involved in cell wall biosynthesis
MKLLVCSWGYYPAIGGIEATSRLLAVEFARRGHEVRLVTHAPGDSPSEPEFELLRRPSRRRLLGLVRWCDIYFHNNPSLRYAWPLSLVRRPWVVAHQTWLPESGARFKRWLLRSATSVSISRAIASHLPFPSSVIPNPYDDEIFRVVPGISRDRDLIFVGRLGADKGADLLLGALAMLKGSGRATRLTLVGAGPDEPLLRRLSHDFGIAEQVEFVGVRHGHDLATILNAHRAIVVPSRWNEPFGIVAIEGIACGCVVVGSAGGGLPDAIGPCGGIFPNGDVDALARLLVEMLGDEARQRRLRAAAPAHLLRHTRDSVAKQYLAIFDSLAGPRARVRRSVRASAGTRATSTRVAQMDHCT